jgi:hypothetical protein
MIKITKKQKNFILITAKSNRLLIVLIVTIIILLSSCISNNNLSVEYGYYYVDRIDSTFFISYNSIFLSNYKNVKIWLLTEKILNKDTIFNSKNKYQKLEENSIVKLDLYKIDTLKCIKSVFNPDRVSGVGYDIDDKKTIWENDTIKYDIYFCPHLIDLYIINNK